VSWPGCGELACEQLFDFVFLGLAVGEVGQQVGNFHLRTRAGSPGDAETVLELLDLLLELESLSGVGDDGRCFPKVGQLLLQESLELGVGLGRRAPRKLDVHGPK
jgi:hypothetical protein